MQILLTNDDGIYAPGLAAMQRQLSRLGDVCVVAPATEQSGVAHSITFLSPLIVKEIYEGGTLRGWAAEGSPADCVKLAVFKYCPQRPDLVVSGINSGQNAGINVLYSGTVAAAIEGAFFGITSIAVSLEYDEHADYDRAAQLACHLIEQILEQKDSGGQLYNLNIPTAALKEPSDVVVVPMDITPWGEDYEERLDPRGRSYYWARGGPQPPRQSHETDLSALRQGKITLTVLGYDLTHHQAHERMHDWNLTVSSTQSSL